MMFMTSRFKKAYIASLFIKILIYIYIGSILFHPNKFMDWFSIVGFSFLIEFLVLALPSLIIMFIKSPILYIEELKEVKLEVENEIKEYSRH